MLPRDDPSYDPEMDRLPPYYPPKRHWYDRLPTNVMVAMVVFLFIQLMLTVVGIFWQQPILIVGSMLNLAWYFVYLWKSTRR